jgi:hypothetical protein
MKNTAINKVFKLAQQLIGKQLPTNQGGHAGRAAEDLVEQLLGITLNRGKGLDVKIWGWEIKTRKRSATSPQTVCTISISDVSILPYKLSPVYEKFQQQLRIYTNELDIIDEAILVDFNQPHIQKLIQEAYEHGQKQIIKNPDIGYTECVDKWGYFEQCHLPNSNAYSFRISGANMNKLEDMAQSTYNELFEEMEL